MRLTEEDMRQRRDVIIDNSYLLFSTRGITKVNVQEIAKASKVSENTIYRYFGNKEKLVLETFVYVWNSVMSEIEMKVKEFDEYELKTGYEQIRLWIRGLKELYKSKRDFILFSYEAKIYLLRHKEKLDAVHRKIMLKGVYCSYMAAIDKGKMDGSIPVKENSEDIFYSIWGALRGYIAKIVIYDELEGEASPWEKHYDVMADGIMCALKHGWKN